MSKVRADRYTNRADDGAPTFSQGVNVVGSGISIGIGASVYSPANNQLVLGTNDSERISITSAGNVGIGTDSPATLLEVGNQSQVLSGAITISNGEIIGGGSGPLINLKHGPVGGTQRTHQIYSYIGNLRIAADSNENMELWTGGSESLRIDSSGNASITDGNLVIGTSGHGIDFSATADGTGSNQDELLDDYETGNWTPAITSGATDVVSYTGGDQDFRYIKVGRLVTLFFSMNNVTTSGNTGGTFLIGGMPFVADAGNPDNRFISGNVMFYNTGLTMSGWPVWAHHAVGNTTINFYEKASAGAGYGSVNVNSVGSGSYFFFSLQYYTA